MQDDHTLFLFTGELPKAVVCKFIRESITSVVPTITDGNVVDKAFYINHPSFGTKVSSRAYLWVKDARVKSALLDRNCAKLVHNGDPYSLKFTSCELNNVEDVYYPNILTTVNKLPRGVKIANLQEVFGKYSSTENVRITMSDGYPIIEFDKNTNDASFALVMQLSTEFADRKYVKFCYQEK